MARNYKKGYNTNVKRNLKNIKILKFPKNFKKYQEIFQSLKTEYSTLFTWTSAQRRILNIKSFFYFLYFLIPCKIFKWPHKYVSMTAWKFFFRYNIIIRFSKIIFIKYAYLAVIFITQIENRHKSHKMKVI